VRADYKVGGSGLVPVIASAAGDSVFFRGGGRCIAPTELYRGRKVDSALFSQHLAHKTRGGREPADRLHRRWTLVGSRLDLIVIDPDTQSKLSTPSGGGPPRKRLG